MLAGWQGDAPPLLGYVETERRAASQVPPWDAARRAEQRIDLRPWLLIATILVLLLDTVLRRWENVQGLADILHRR